MKYYRPHEHWPGLEHLPTLHYKTKPLQNEVWFRLKNLDGILSKRLNSFIKKVDNVSCLGETGVRVVFASSLLLLAFGFYKPSMIPLMILFGSIVIYYLIDKKMTKQPVSVTDKKNKEHDPKGKSTKIPKKTQKSTKPNSKKNLDKFVVRPIHFKE